MLGMFHFHARLPAGSEEVYISLDTIDVFLSCVDELSPLTGGDDALDLIQTAIRTGRAILYHIASDLASTAAAACLGCSPLDGSVMGGEAGSGGLAFPRLGLGHCRGSSTHDDNEVEEDRGRMENIRSSRTSKDCPDRKSVV